MTKFPPNIYALGCPEVRLKELKTSSVAEQTLIQVTVPTPPEQVLLPTSHSGMLSVSILTILTPGKES